MTRSVRFAIAAAVAAITALSASLAVSASAGESHAMRMKGAGHPASSTSNLIDHGGAVLSGSNTYAVFWGTQSAWSSDVQTGIGNFFGGLNGSKYLGDIATQYMRGAGVSTSWKGSVTDTSSSPPKSNPSTSTILNEVVKVYGPNLDPNGIYFVFTSNFPRGVNYCAWHSWGSHNGTEVQFAYMPNTGGVRGCDPGNPDNVSGSQDLRSLANVTSHEYMEAITDADGSAWFDASGSEIGDKCAWTFNGTVTLGGTKWYLQQEWSNAAGGCIQS